MRSSVFTGAVLLSISANAMTVAWSPIPEDALKGEGFDDQPQPMLAAVPNGGAFDRTGWVYTADSEQAGMGRYNAMDGDSNTLWHSMYSPVIHKLPHTLTIDMKVVKYVDGITYRPRQDGSPNGNIGQHKIYTSINCVDFGDPVSYGTWFDDQTSKSSAFELHPARCVQIVAVTEAGNRGPWTSASEFYIYGTTDATKYTKPNPSLGLWGPTIDFPLVPVSAAVEPDTGILQTWSSYSPLAYWAGHMGQTQTSSWNPATKLVTERLITNTKHDMFCSGISFDATGRVIITGGDTSTKMSIYTGGSDAWTAGPDMTMPRAYQSQVTLGDGRLFVIGGSWVLPAGGKNGEIFDPKTNKWSKLSKCLVAPMLTADAKGDYRADNHGWLFNWKKGYVFQAGPSKKMNWYNMLGADGGNAPAGTRGDDGDSMCGNAVMYDASLGKILTVGGSPNYDNTASTSKAHIITLGNNAPDTTVPVANINPMWFPRIFQNSVVLPNGQVFITGGQSLGYPFHDDGAILTPEIFDPTTNAFIRMTPNSIPRNYHSIALLLTDGTVASCGGGLCNTCSTNHFDCQIFTPPYLLNADGSLKNRPTITSVSARSNTPGSTITVTTTGTVVSFSMIRYSTTTHTVNTDQRRIPLPPTLIAANTYKITLGPEDVGVVTPGYWMLYALDAAGVPSKASTIHIQTWT